MKKQALQKVIDELPEDFDINIITYINGGDILLEGKKEGKKHILFFGELGGFKRKVVR